MGIVLILIPVVVAIVATITDTTRKERPFPGRVTLAGWFLIVLSISAGVINYLQVNEQTRQREIRRFVAAKQIEKAIYTLSLAYLVDRIDEHHRFQVTSDHGDGGQFASICDFDLQAPVNSDVGDYFVSSDMLRGIYIADRTQQGLTLLEQTQATYGDVLGNDVNLYIGLVLNHPWNEFLLASRDRVNRFARNHPKEELVHPLCDNDKGIRASYVKEEEAYRAELAHLEKIVGQNICALRTHPGIEDDPPVLLRLSSRWYFIAARFAATSGASLVDHTAAGCHAIGAPGYDPAPVKPAAPVLRPYFQLTPVSR